MYVCTTYFSTASITITIMDTAPTLRQVVSYQLNRALNEALDGIITKSARAILKVSSHSFRE